MVKKIGVFLVFLFCVVTSFAQNIVVKGVLKDADTKEGLMQATVQLLRSDSTFVGGSISDEQGLFQLSAPSENILSKFLTLATFRIIKRLMFRAKTPLMLAQL